ncbi:hypothetical protein Celaphus_00016983 [Cervus elaphus hippelaphus]|uniref:Uncharacterized protein n=1 Tax=Cervus elaphus hippelaphus TaxID=46360 RepID=A0A212CN36_CEREH|nr:hypothetical protein Celaphus_00016983 [Cervus elaphus hippelaphus]
MALPLGTIPRSSSPHSSWRSAISGPVCSSCAISGLSSWHPESERELCPGRKHPEEVSGVLMGRKAQEIQRVGSLWNVRCRKLAEIHVLDFPGDSNVHKETENPDSSQVTCDSGDHSKSQLTKILEKPLQAHVGEKVVTTRAVSPLESLFPAPSWKPSPQRSPLTGQEKKPPPQAPSYNSVGRICDSESVVETDNGA